jgi:hypothetical protein
VRPGVCVECTSIGIGEFAAVYTAESVPVITCSIQRWVLKRVTPYKHRYVLHGQLVT